MPVANHMYATSDTHTASSKYSSLLPGYITVSYHGFFGSETSIGTVKIQTGSCRQIPWSKSPHSLQSHQWPQVFWKTRMLKSNDTQWNNMHQLFKKWCEMPTFPQFINGFPRGKFTCGCQFWGWYFSVEPSSIFIFQTLGQVPVIDGCQRLNTCLVQFIQKGSIKLYSFRIWLPTSSWQQTRPRDGETVCWKSYLLHHFHILLEFVVVITSDTAIVAILHFTFSCTEGVPNTCRPSTFESSTFNLVGSSGTSPKKVFRELQAYGSTCTRCTRGWFLGCCRGRLLSGCSSLWGRPLHRTVACSGGWTKRARWLNSMLFEPTALSETKRNWQHKKRGN